MLFNVELKIPRISIWSWSRSNLHISLRDRQLRSGVSSYVQAFYILSSSFQDIADRRESGKILECSAISPTVGLEIGPVMQSGPTRLSGANFRCKAWRHALALLLLGGFAYFGSVRFGFASAGEE